MLQLPTTPPLHMTCVHFFLIIFYSNYLLFNLIVLHSILASFSFSYPLSDHITYIELCYTFTFLSYPYQIS